MDASATVRASRPSSADQAELLSHRPGGLLDVAAPMGDLQVRLLVRAAEGDRDDMINRRRHLVGVPECRVHGLPADDTHPVVSVADLDTTSSPAVWPGLSA